MLKIVMVFAMISASYGAYDDLPTVADPYQPPGTNPEACSDQITEIISQTRTEFGVGSLPALATNIGKRVQLRFGVSHEVLVSKNSNIVLKSNTNETICKQFKDPSGLGFIIYPTPGKYDINDIASEDFFAKLG